MNTPDQFVKSLTEKDKQALLEHFNTIYECAELTESEYNIAYLGWLWANGKVHHDADSGYFIEKNETGISMHDYEITIEDEDSSGGTNLWLTHSYYSLDQLIEKMGW